MKSVSSWAVAVVASVVLVACGDDGSASGSAGGGGGGAGTAATGTASGPATTAGSASGGPTSGTAAGTGAGGEGSTAGQGGQASTSGPGTSGPGTGGQDTSSGQGGGGGQGETVELPDVYGVVQAVAAEHPELLEINTYESCGELVQHVLAALADDPEWGHVSKTAGESQYTPPGFVPHEVDGWLITGFSQDAIFHRAAYRQVDIIGNAAANSDPDPAIHGPATITWQVIEPKYYRENNPWIPAVPLP